MTQYQCNVRIEDNGGGFLIVVRDEALHVRLVVAAFQTLNDAWRHIVWMYQIESQSFTVSKKEVPIKDWIDGMKMCGYID